MDAWEAFFFGFVAGCFFSVAFTWTMSRIEDAKRGTKKGGGTM